MKTVELTKEQREIAVTALSYYQDLICMGDAEGTDKDLDALQSIINKIIK